MLLFKAVALLGFISWKHCGAHITQTKERKPNPTSCTISEAAQSAKEVPVGSVAAGLEAGCEAV